MRFSPSSRMRIGGQSGLGSSSEVMPGIQNRRQRSPIGVPGPTWHMVSLSCLLSIGCLRVSMTPRPEVRGYALSHTTPARRPGLRSDKRLRLCRRLRWVQPLTYVLDVGAGVDAFVAHYGPDEGQGRGTAWEAGAVHLRRVELLKLLDQRLALRRIELRAHLLDDLGELRVAVLPGRVVG